MINFYNDVLERFKEHTVVNAIFQKPIDIELLKTLRLIRFNIILQWI